MSRFEVGQVLWSQYCEKGEKAKWPVVVCRVIFTSSVPSYQVAVIDGEGNLSEELLIFKEIQLTRLSQFRANQNNSDLFMVYQQALLLQKKYQAKKEQLVKNQSKIFMESPQELRELLWSLGKKSNCCIKVANKMLEDIRNFKLHRRHIIKYVRLSLCQLMNFLVNEMQMEEGFRSTLEDLRLDMRKLIAQTLINEGIPVDCE